MEDIKWIKAAKKGDNQALAHLFKENYPLLVHYLMKLTLNREEAEDLAQETMAKAIEKLSQFQLKSKFSTWLISIGTKLYIDQQRRQKRADNFKDQHIRKLTWQAQTQNDDWDSLLAALGELEDELRVPIILKHYYGYAYDEIGKMLGIAEGTVKSRVHRGIKTVRKELGEDEKRSGTMENPIEQG